MNHEIFISYSSKQKSIADGICHYLEENGFKCWMAPRDIPIGSEYGDLIEEAIKTCKVVVLIFSLAASISKWVKGEINVAFTEDKPILPFRVDETEVKGGFRVMLNQMHWIDAYPHYANRLPDLLSSISNLLGKPAKNVNVSGDMPKRDETIRVELNCSEKTTNIFSGHEYVDLGLPSGTLWATCNVGAGKPEDYGDYLSWDEGKTAAANWGIGWCMPSKKQWEELIQNTNNTWTKRNGVNGRLFTANNGEVLFLPAAGSDGYYWSTLLYMGLPNDAWYFYFRSDCYLMYYFSRSSGISVRPVRSTR